MELATGVALTYAAESARLEAQVFVEVQADATDLRFCGSIYTETLSQDGGDLINALVDAAHTARERHLGELLGDLRRAGVDVARWDFYAAPFRVEACDSLRNLVSAATPRR